jgi:hypothetical protein
MEKNDLENKMYDKKFLDSMNYVQKTASDLSNKKVTPENATILWNGFASVVPRDYLRPGFEYFINKEDNSGETLYALGLLLSYAKDRYSDIDSIISDYALKGSKKMRDFINKGHIDGEEEKSQIIKDKGPLRERENSILPPSDI